MSIATVGPLPKDLAGELKASGTWQEWSPVPLQRLSLINVKYIDFDGIEHEDGQMVALDAVSENVAEVFSQLYKRRFPIAKIRSLHQYGGDDELSMADNNSSAYCCRPIIGTEVVSTHAFGIAIDINPQQNPYLVFDEDAGRVTIYPSKGWEFLNRSNQKPGMVEEVVSLIASCGFFVWGGRWTTPIDYHHFQLPRGIGELLLVLSPEHGKKLVDATVKERQRLASMPSGEELQPLIELYRRNPSDFFERWLAHV